MSGDVQVPDGDRDVEAVRELLEREIAAAVAANIRRERANVRCLDCGIRYEERQEYSCNDSGRPHYIDDEMLAEAEAEGRADPIEYVTMSVAELRGALASQPAPTGDLSPMRVESHGPCGVGPAIGSQWRNDGHWHTVWPEGESWCFRTVDEAVERAAEVRDIWIEHPHMVPAQSGDGVAEAGSRFDPDNEQLRKSLAWHAQITADLQRRIVEATKHARGRSDYQMLAILGAERDVARTTTEEGDHG